jgi:hypothetical protein
VLPTKDLGGNGRVGGVPLGGVAGEGGCCLIRGAASTGQAR